MNVKHLSYKFIAVALAVILLFTVSFDTPVSVKAATGDFDFQETSMSVSDTKAYVVAGIDDVAFGVILVIVGFIVLTYVTLRNVNVPIDYSSTDSFIDKCKQLGQFAYDNMSLAITGIFKSARDFKDAHPEMSTVTAISSFTALNVVSMFRALSNWFASSFITDRSIETEGVLNIIRPYTGIEITDPYSALASVCATQWSYADELVSRWPRFNSDVYLGVPGPIRIYSDTEFSPQGSVVLANDLFYPSYYPYLITVVQNIVDGVSTYDFGISRLYDSSGDINGANAIPINGYLSYRLYSTRSTPNSYNTYDYIYSIDGTNTISYRSGSFSSLRVSLGSYAEDGGPSDPNCVSVFSEWLTHFLSLGAVFYLYKGYANDITWNTGLTFNRDDIEVITAIPSVIVPESVDIVDGDEDTYAAPDEAVWDINKIARDVSASALTLEQLKELLKNGASTISLESALTNAVTMPSGSYTIPSLDGVWKYPRYMFATLGSYITFLGTALRSVTVGEGGLSWLFFGAFVLLVCGGVIGKMLL